MPNYGSIVKERNDKFSHIEVSQSFVSNSACDSPPNLASPRFGIGNTQESGSASLTNVIKWVKEYNKDQTKNSDEVNIVNSDPKGLMSEETKSEQKRKRRATPVISPRLQGDKSSKRARHESTHKLTTLADGTVSLESLLALNVGQLRKLSMDLQLNLPLKMKKKELR